MVQVKDILAWIDDFAPFRWAASWDNSGLLVGDPHAEVERIVVALEPSSTTIAEVEQAGPRQCLVTHHPLIFSPLKSIRTDSFPGNLIARALKGGIHLIAAHTNLDAAREGTNGVLARLLGLEALEPLETDPLWRDEEAYGGMGCVGLLPESMPLGELVERLRKVLGAADMRVAGDPGNMVRKTALCTGSGASLARAAFAAGAQAYITGDVKYHDAQWAVEVGLSLIDVGHFASERLVVEPLAARLRSWASGRGVEVAAASQEKDPFWPGGRSF